MRAREPKAGGVGNVKRLVAVPHLRPQAAARAGWRAHCQWHGHGAAGDLRRECLMRERCQMREKGKPWRLFGAEQISSLSCSSEPGQPLLGVEAQEADSSYKSATTDGSEAAPPGPAARMELADEGRGDPATSSSLRRPAGWAGGGLPEPSKALRAAEQQQRSVALQLQVEASSEEEAVHGGCR